MTNPIHKCGRYSTELKQKVATEAIAGNKILSALFASERLASLRSAPSLRSGRRSFALKALKNWFDSRKIA